MLPPRLPRPMVPPMPIRQKWHSSTMPCIRCFQTSLSALMTLLWKVVSKLIGMKALIGTLFSYSKDTMDNQLFSSGFVRDEAGKADDATNKGYLIRRAWTNQAAGEDFYGKIFVDLFLQSRYLIGNVNMRIKLIKAAHAFAIWTNVAGERPKIVFESAKLYLRKIKPHPQILATDFGRGWYTRHKQRAVVLWENTKNTGNGHGRKRGC